MDEYHPSPKLRTLQQNMWQSLIIAETSLSLNFVFALELLDFSYLHIHIHITHFVQIHLLVSDKNGTEYIKSHVQPKIIIVL